MKTILVAEDDPLTAKLYSGILEKAGFHVELAANGQVCLDKVDALKPSAILLDIMMPILNGLDVLKHIRAKPSGQLIPVLAMTNAYVPKMIEEARLAGANVIFNKATLTPLQLTETLNKFLNPPDAAAP